MRLGDAVRIVKGATGDRGLIPDQLRATHLDGTVTLARDGEESFRPELIGGASRVVLPLGTYTRIRGRAQRVAFLSSLREHLRPTGHVVVHANVPQGTGAMRLMVDAPLAIADRLLGHALEPGDRFAPHYEHLFFDEHALVEEGRDAGLSLLDREDLRFTFGPRGGRESTTPAITMPRELALLAPLMPRVERTRLGLAPREMLEWARRRGRSSEERDLHGRVMLRSAIAWLDAAFPSGPNCLRRVLAEVASDRGAASQEVVLGLDVGRSGHAWLRSTFRPSPVRFDVEFIV